MSKFLDYNKPDFTVKYENFPKLFGYKIVYPYGNKELMVCAKHLRNFFRKEDCIDVEIVSDATAVGKKEILIGDTNRYKTSLSENEFAVTVKDNTLIFEGGHFVMVDKAVKWFMAQTRCATKMATLKGEANDFKSSVIIDGEKYDYVWGDEFDGNFFDQTRFVQRCHMGDMPYSARVLIGENETFKIEDGMMKMSAINYTEDNNPEIMYAVPECPCTDDTMWWLYGYAEIRAKVPMHKGSWPAWWSTSYCHSKEGKTDDWKYLVEVDFLEVFSNESFIDPNIHKWYENYAGKFSDIKNEEGKKITWQAHTDLNLPRTKYHMPKEEKYGYHTYGFKWTPDEMVMSVDGQEYMRYDLNDNFDNHTDMEHFKKEPLHLIFDNWIYAPGGGMTDDGNMVLPEYLPFEFFVEYVRLYQKPGQGYVQKIGLDKEF